MTVAFSFAQTFEGVIEATTSTKATKENAVVKWFVKNGSSRMEITGTADGKQTNATLLFQKSNAQLYLLSEMNGEKAVFIVPQDSLKIVAKNVSTIVTKTEGKKSVAGYNCYLVKIQSPEGTSECWVSDEVKLSAESFPPSLRSKGIIGSMQSNGITALPLEVISKDNGGEVQYSFTVKSITAQSVPDAQFQLPADVQSGEELLKKSMKAE